MVRSWRLSLRIVLVIVAAFLLWWRLAPHHVFRPHGPGAIPDLSVSNPLNQSGGGAAPADAYPVYSALYQEPQQEPLVFAEDSVTDIPQVGASCLKPSTADEREMNDAFVAANRQSQRWEPKFTIASGYRLLTRTEAARVQSCLDTHGQGATKCAAWRDIRHIRFLGVPGFDHDHSHALVSVIRMCGSFCGSGGIFEVAREGSSWKRVPSTPFTSDCSWMY